MITSLPGSSFDIILHAQQFCHYFTVQTVGDPSFPGVRLVFASFPTPMDVLRRGRVLQSASPPSDEPHNQQSDHNITIQLVRARISTSCGSGGSILDPAMCRGSAVSSPSPAEQMTVTAASGGKISHHFCDGVSWNNMRFLLLRLRSLPSTRRRPSDLLTMDPAELQTHRVSMGIIQSTRLQDPTSHHTSKYGRGHCVPIVCCRRRRSHYPLPAPIRSMVAPGIKGESFTITVTMAGSLRSHLFFTTFQCGRTRILWQDFYDDQGSRSRHGALKSWRILEIPAFLVSPNTRKRGKTSIIILEITQILVFCDTSQGGFSSIIEACQKMFGKLNIFDIVRNYAKPSRSFFTKKGVNI